MNKNNYGVITPDRFNYIAKDAQLKIINELPMDIYRAKNRRNKSGLVEALPSLQNALDIFTDRKTIQREASLASPNGFTDYFVLPDDFYYVKSVWYNDEVRMDELDKVHGRYVLANKLTSPTTQFPVYEKRSDFIYVFPTTIGIDTSGGSNVATSDVSIYYQRRPKDPKWTYIVAPNGKPVYNPSDASFQDFELPEYMLNRITVEIALFCGIHLREQEVEQTMNQEQADNFQKKNLN